MGRCVAIVFFSVLTLWGQSNFGRISGTVTDSTGATIPGVTVTVQDARTGFKQTASTQDSGLYIFPSLPAGAYELSAEKQGFGTRKTSGVVLDASSARTVDFSLAPGAVTESVSVEATAQQVETSSGEVSSTINNRQVTEVALNGRNFMQLLRLVPGTVATTLDPLAIGLTTTGQQVNGVRTNIDARVDGVANVDSGGNISQRSTPNPDSIAEVKVLTSGYAAEYGGRAGALMNVVTKSGTRDFHGTLFEFNRNNAFDARNFFAATPSILHFNDFGWTLGGPVIIPGKRDSTRDKLFFFWSEEWKYQHTGNTATGLIPTDAERSGNFVGSRLAAPTDPTNGQPFPNAVVPPTRWSKNGPLLLKPYPTPNFNSPAGNYTVTTPQKTDPREDLIKGDWVVSDKTRVAARYSKAYWNQTNVVAGTLGIVPFDSPRPSYLTSINMSHSFSSTLLNYASFGAGFDAFLATSHPDKFSKSTLGLTIPEVYNYNLFGAGPNVVIAGFVGYATGGQDRKRVFDFEFHDDLTRIAGSHTWKFGAMVIRSRTDEYNFGQENSNGTVSFNTSARLTSRNAIADVLLGNFQNYTEDQVSGFYWSRYTQTELYAQDTWKVNKRLTLNYGLRYNIHPPVNSPLSDGGSFIPSFYSAAQAPSVSRANGALTGGDPWNGLALPGTGWPDKAQGRVLRASDPASTRLFRGLPDGFAPTNHGGYGPRFGFAYDVFGNGKTAIRGGYGIFYDTWIHATWAVPSRSLPLAASANLFDGNIDNPAGGTQSTFPGTVVAFPDSAKPSTVQSINLNIQHQLPGQFIADVGYVGTLGRNLPRVRNIDQLPVGTLTNPANRGVNANALRPYLGYSTIAAYEQSDNSNYNSLQMTLNRRVSGGLAFGTSFTYSRALDTTAGGSYIAAALGPQDAYNVRGDYGLSSLHRKYVLSLNYQYELPFFRKSNALLKNTVGGWTLSGVISAQSGVPQSVTVASDVAGIGVASSRASVNGQDPNDSAGRTLGRWFNTAAFLPVSQMTQGQFGNSGRDILIGPGYNSVDLSLYKNIKVTEKIGLQFRAESFNTLNHASFTTLGTVVGTGTFGAVTAAAPGRAIQLGLKLLF